MIDESFSENTIHCVTNFNDLVTTPFLGSMNAIYWKRKLEGDFSEIVNKIESNINLIAIEEDDLRELQLSEQGQRARDILINDLATLRAHGASPMLNLIKCYDKDDSYPFFPIDVYSFHVDRSPVPTDTFLCTYHGTSSEILPNSQAEQKIFIPEVRSKLKQTYDGPEEEFETFLKDNFFDLHYQALPHANIFSLGLGNLWRLAVDYPESKVLPCIHRAPAEKIGEARLLLIC